MNNFVRNTAVNILNVCQKLCLNDKPNRVRTAKMNDHKVLYKMLFWLWQSLLMMEEIQPHTSQINNPKYAVVIKKASFSWDQEVSVVQANGLLDVQITGQFHYIYTWYIFSFGAFLNIHLFHCQLKSEITLSIWFFFHIGGGFLL